MDNAAATETAITTTRFECVDDGARWEYAGNATDIDGIVADYGSQTHVQMGYDAYGPARTVTITVEQIETDGDGDDAVIDRRKVEIAVPAGTEG
jgi:hypothetical protein